MNAFLARIRPRSAFGSLIKGDTLFGQLCWALRHQMGEAELERLLDGYTEGKPFCVLADALPSGYWPRPMLPGSAFDTLAGGDRKQVRRRRWLPYSSFQEPIQNWLAHCIEDADLIGAVADEHAQSHNSIDRRNGTTGDGQFAPYQMPQWWFGGGATLAGADTTVAIEPGSRLDLYIVLDSGRLSINDLNAALTHIGAFGFGRDASIGLGKFDVDSITEVELPAHPDADSWVTLAPCAPQGLPWRPDLCFYTPFTRFGRHGDIAVHGGKPFKAPVLLADTAAVLTPDEWSPRLFTGQGLGGNGSLSRRIAGTVHQAYAPVLSIRLPNSLHDRRTA